MINRSAVTVRGKAPFLAWLRGLPDPVDADLTLDEINNERTVYLLPDVADADDSSVVLSEYYDLIFESELEGWWTKESDWPANRDFELFGEWFDVEQHSIVEDLVDAPLFDED